MWCGASREPRQARRCPPWGGLPRSRCVPVTRRPPAPEGPSNGRCRLNPELPGPHVSALLANLTLSSDGSLDHRDMLEGRGDDKGQDSELPECARQPPPPSPPQIAGPVGPGSPFGTGQIQSNVWQFCFRDRAVRSRRASRRRAMSAAVSARGPAEQVPVL